MQNSFPYSREYISFFLFFFTGSRKGSPSRESMKEREWEREGERGPEFLETFVIFEYFERNCRESIWKIISRDERVSIWENLLEKEASKLISRKIQLIRREKKGKRILFERNIRFSILSFHRESRRIKEQLWGKEKKRDLLSPFSPLRLSPAR